MRELKYGSYTISPDPVKTKALYAKRGPYLLKCACPGCQNFFKAIVPYRPELEAALSPLGAVWNKPDSIEALDARENTVYYRLIYTVFASGKLPKKWVRQKNELGSINVRSAGADYELCGNIRFSFSRAGENRLRLEARAELPWVMETMNCIYDPAVKSTAKKLPGRIARIYRGAKHIIGSIKNK